MADSDPSYSIVEYMNDHSGYRCGYCKSKDTNYSHGMWAHRMSVENYQDLIDRGWRRSGKYCYKPMMSTTCCPQYTIKCDAVNFKISKSQKKVIKRLNNYLNYGNVRSSNSSNSEGNMEETGTFIQESLEQIEPKREIKNNLSSFKIPAKYKVEESKPCTSSNNCVQEDLKSGEHENLASNSNQKEPPEIIHSCKPGSGIDMSKPPCKKAKLLRLERYAVKMSCKESTANKLKKNNAPKSLEELLSEPLIENPAHRFECCLVRVGSSIAKFQTTYKDSMEVFRNYQMTIHKESEDECNHSTFRSFLVDCPILPWSPSSGPPLGYGPFHQQYWLDGQLIAVGVIDILPHCVSSVYLYYDPKYSFLSLGTYSSLREISLTRVLNRFTPKLQWYYMGFYIHSCVKMRYKGNYNPSYLLCPATYSWEPIKMCLPKLNISKYSKLNEDLSATGIENIDIKKVLCLHNGEPILYGMLQTLLGTGEEDEKEVEEYATLVGAKCAYSMLLYKG